MVAKILDSEAFNCEGNVYHVFNVHFPHRRVDLAKEIGPCLVGTRYSGNVGTKVLMILEYPPNVKNALDAPIVIDAKGLLFLGRRIGRFERRNIQLRVTPDD